MISKIIRLILDREKIVYLIFGVLTTAVDWIVYTATRYAGFDYKFSTVTAWIAAVVFSYITNKIWVFENHDFRFAYLIKEFISFVACRLFTGLLTLVCMIIFVDYIGISDFLSKLIISVAVIILNYVFSKLFIFKKETH